MRWKRLPALALAVVGCGLILPAVTRADNERDIDNAVRRAIDFLKRSRSGVGWRCAHPQSTHDFGLTALCTLALLEAEVPKDDPVVAAAAKYVRDNIGIVQQASESNTYGLSLAIIMLDRYYQDASIKPLIQHLTLQLIAAQSVQDGGWTYDAPPISKAQADSLHKQLEKTRNKPLPADALKGLERGSVSDNSNTQFAILALWIGRRHGVAVTQPLLLAERRFRKTAVESGGWGYGRTAGQEASSATMTCAGLIG